MYHPIHLLSRNTKTGRSIDLPLQGHCRPSPNCAHDCYARTGHQARPDAIKKHEFMSRYLAGTDQTELIQECRLFTAVRLCGSGDLNPEHVPAILRLAKSCPQTMFWGMTRKPEIAGALNNRLPNLRVLLTVDSSSPDSVWNYQGALCFGPRRPGDEVPEDPRIITVFPRHFGGRVVKGVQRHRKDCLSVWHELPGCHACKRCWSWKNFN